MAKLVFTVSLLLKFLYVLVAVITLSSASPLPLSDKKPPEKLNLHDPKVYAQLFDEVNNTILGLFNDSAQVQRMLIVIREAWNLVNLFTFCF